jgi:hypothetical protein
VKQNENGESAQQQVTAVKRQIRECCVIRCVLKQYYGTIEFVNEKPKSRLKMPTHEFAAAFRYLSALKKRSRQDAGINTKQMNGAEGRIKLLSNINELLISW